MTGDDVFILDLGFKAYIWTGSTANKDERFAAVFRETVFSLNIMNSKYSGTPL